MSRQEKKPERLGFGIRMDDEDFKNLLEGQVVLLKQSHYNPIMLSFIGKLMTIWGTFEGKEKQVLATVEDIIPTPDQKDNNLYLSYYADL